MIQNPTTTKPSTRSIRQFRTWIATLTKSPIMFLAMAQPIVNKEEAERRFTGLIDELQAVLPPERWTGSRDRATNRFDSQLYLGDQISDAGSTST